jgi:hypothetical protein
VLVEEQRARYVGAAEALSEEFLEVGNGILARSFPAEFQTHRRVPRRVRRRARVTFFTPEDRRGLGFRVALIEALEP